MSQDLTKIIIIIQVVFIFVNIIIIIILFLFLQRYKISPLAQFRFNLKFSYRATFNQGICFKILNTLFILRPSKFIPLTSTTRRALQDALGAPWVPLASSVPLHDVPFRMHYVLQGCHSSLSTFLVQRALQDTPHAPRVPLAS